MSASFEVIQPVGRFIPVVAHVPHSSTLIPSDVRERLLVDDAVLARELLRMTDWLTDELYAGLPGLGIPMLVNRVSRLVVDPERFTDDAQEPMARVGQGAVYTRTTEGEPLRTSDPVERGRLIEAFYVPYHAALTDLVERAMAAFGRCLVIDCHSFATVPHPSEPDQDPDRPDICIGTDPTHTPPELADRLRRT